MSSAKRWPLFMLAGFASSLLLVFWVDLVRPARALSPLWYVSRFWLGLPLLAGSSLLCVAVARFMSHRDSLVGIARRFRQAGLIAGLVVGVPLALLVVEACVYDPLKFTYLIHRVEEAGSAAEERSAFELAARWGHVWELNRIREREHLPVRAQHLRAPWILELEWLESWPSGRPYHAYRVVLNEENLRVFDQRGGS